MGCRIQSTPPDSMIMVMGELPNTSAATLGAVCPSERPPQSPSPPPPETGSTHKREVRHRPSPAARHARPAKKTPAAIPTTKSSGPGRCCPGGFRKSAAARRLQANQYDHPDSRRCQAKRPSLEAARSGEDTGREGDHRDPGRPEQRIDCTREERKHARDGEHQSATRSGPNWSGLGAVESGFFKRVDLRSYGLIEARRWQLALSTRSKAHHNAFTHADPKPFECSPSKCRLL